MSNNKWEKRVRSCSTIWTHPDIPWQVIQMNNTGKITCREIEFKTVEEAMKAIEDYYLPVNIEELRQ